MASLLHMYPVIATTRVTIITNDNDMNTDDSITQQHCDGVNDCDNDCNAPHVVKPAKMSVVSLGRTGEGSRGEGCQGRGGQ